jgi:hypothetical protein
MRRSATAIAANNASNGIGLSKHDFLLAFIFSKACRRLPWPGINIREARFNPSVCLPVVLPPGQKEVTYDVEVVGGGNVSGKVKSPGRGLVCAPLGAEQHPRHPHGITIDVARQRAYQVIEHSGLRWNADRTAFQVAYTTDEESGLTLAWDINAEHTGLAANEPPPGTEDEEGESAEHFLGRYVVEVEQPSAVNRTTKQATAPVHLIDLSHGYTIVDYPNIENIPDGLKTLEKSFVHAHFIWVDPLRDALLVTGEHTGNLGVVDTRTRQLEQVIGISRAIPDCVLPPPEDPTLPPEAEEPHVHGVTVQPLTGAVYVMDEGEHCFYESATVLKPKDEHHNNDHR